MNNNHNFIEKKKMLKRHFKQMEYWICMENIATKRRKKKHDKIAVRVLRLK